MRLWLFAYDRRRNDTRGKAFHSGHEDDTSTSSAASIVGGRGDFQKTFHQMVASDRGEAGEKKIDARDKEHHSSKVGGTGGERVGGGGKVSESLLVVGQQRTTRCRNYLGD